MAKRKTAFVCNECGSEHANWQGQCRDCKAWNTLSEITLSNSKNAHHHGQESMKDSLSGYASARSEVTLLSEVNLEELPRIKSDIEEFDRVLGNEFVALPSKSGSGDIHGEQTAFFQV